MDIVNTYKYRYIYIYTTVCKPSMHCVSFMSCVSFICRRVKSPTTSIAAYI